MYNLSNCTATLCHYLSNKNNTDKYYINVIFDINKFFLTNSLTLFFTSQFKTNKQKKKKKSCFFPSSCDMASWAKSKVTTGQL